MPYEKGKKMKDWHCSICGRIYCKRDSTRRKVLNNWWKHMKKYHPATYAKKKRESVKKAKRTRKRKKKGWD